MRSLYSYVSSVRQRAAALFHRSNHLETDAAERQRRWKQVIAAPQKPLEPPKDSGETTRAQ
jgi:hypothetical protein